MKSLLLDLDAWDLVLDAEGNIAVCTEPYSIAQDVACACRTFKGELVYDVGDGVPYFSEILGQWSPLSLARERLKAAALSVKEVAEAQIIITSIEGRQLSGQVQFIDVDGNANGVTF